MGRGNYKYFLALLLGTTLLLSYGAYLAYSTLKPEVNHHFKQYPYWHELEFAGRTDWAGTTTNESGKWSDWKEDMHDGLCFMTDMDAAQFYAHDSSGALWGGYDPNLWKRSAWPKRSSQFLVLTQDGQYPRNLPAEIMALVGDAEWRRVWKLTEVNNTYDLGFWGNFMDMLTN